MKKNIIKNIFVCFSIFLILYLSTELSNYALCFNFSDKSCHKILGIQCSCCKDKEQGQNNLLNTSLKNVSNPCKKCLKEPLPADINFQTFIFEPKNLLNIKMLSNSFNNGLNSIIFKDIGYYQVHPSKIILNKNLEILKTVILLI